MAESVGDQVTIRIPTPLRGYTQGIDQISVSAKTVGDALAVLAEVHPGILEHIVGIDGSLREFVNIYVGSDNVQSLQGLATPLPAGAVLAIVPAVAGGATR